MKTIGAAAVLALGAGAHGQLWLVESFENGSNAAGWTFSAPNELIEPTGGYYNSGAYLHLPGAQTPMPAVGTTPGHNTPFTGNYRAMGITQVGATLIVHQSDVPVASRRPAALLVSFNGTPADPSDDWGAFTLAFGGLGSPGVWQMHGFVVPRSMVTMPSTWTYLRIGANAPATVDWNALMQGVDRLVFTFGDPSVTYAPQNWNVGVDYLFVSDAPTCYPNCDDSTSPPFLNVLDFICFLNRFAAGDTWANCDNSTQVPALNVLDFACFLMRMAAGCQSP